MSSFKHTLSSVLRITLSISFFVEREFSSKSIFPTNKTNHRLNPPVRNNMLKERLACSKLRIHLPFKAILQWRTNHPVIRIWSHRPLSVSRSFDPFPTEYSEPRRFESHASSNTPYTAAPASFSGRQTAKSCVFPSSLDITQNRSTSTLIVRLALHRTNLLIHEIEVFLSALREKRPKQRYDASGDRTFGERKLAQRVAEKFSLLGSHRSPLSGRKEAVVLLLEGRIVVEFVFFREFARRRRGFVWNERRSHCVGRATHALDDIRVLVELVDDSVEALLHLLVCVTLRPCRYHHWIEARRYPRSGRLERCCNRLRR